MMSHRIASAASVLLALSALSASASARTPLQKLWFDTIDVGNLGLITTMLDQNVVSIGTLVDDEGNTALHLASERCNTAVVTLLMKRGAKPDLRNKWSDTPLTIAKARCGANSSVLNALRRPVAAVSQSVGSMVWQGRSTHNRVIVQFRPEGFFVSPVSSNPGQSTKGLLYRKTSDGKYRYFFPDGKASVVEMVAPRQLRVTNPDGWTDVFTPVG